MNKTPALIAALMIMAALFSSCTKNPQYEEEDNFVVQPLTRGTARIVNYLDETQKGDINIPPRIQKMRITEIGPDSIADRWFERVYIPDSVTNIMDFSLSGNYIRYVKFPKKLTEIGTGAFMNNHISSIVIPASVKKIGYRAFFNNPLMDITIGGDVEFGELSGYDTGKQEEWNYTPFEGTGFDEAYQQNDRKAGSYRRENGVWRYVPRS